MTKLFLFTSFFFFLFIDHPVVAQNLVSNGDFENYSSLPTLVGQLNFVTGWTNLNGGTLWPYATPDFLHTAGSGQVQLPNSVFATVSPYSGNAIVGFVTKHNTVVEFREYVSTQFNTPLVVGNTYTISFWITNGASNWYGGYSSDHVGVRFSTNPIIQIDHEPVGGVPQFEIPGQVYSTTWQNITFSFVADSAYNFITFGNFYDDQSTTLVHQNSSSGPASYYFIDHVEVNSNPCNTVVNLGNDTTLCSGSSITLSALVNNGNYLWQDSSTNPTYTVTQGGTYWVTVTDSCGTQSDTIHVTYNTSPQVNLGPDTIICNGSSLILDASSSGASYQWQNNSTSPTFTVSQSGLYGVTVTANGCSTSDSIFVNYSSLNINLGKDTILCLGHSLLLDATIASGNYLWQDGSTDSTYLVDHAGTYWVQVSNDCGTMSDTLHVTGPQLLSLDIGADTTVCEGNEILLTAAITGNGILKWQDGTTSKTFDVKSSGTFRATLSDVCSSVIDSVKVTFENCSCSVFVPNAFSPNKDGLNEEFGPTFNCDISDYKFMVYNRWGELVHETNNLLDWWDGKIKGQEANIGVYFYLVRYRIPGQNIDYISGDFTLLR